MYFYQAFVVMLMYSSSGLSCILGLFNLYHYKFQMLGVLLCVLMSCK